MRPPPAKWGGPLFTHAELPGATVFWHGSAIRENVSRIARDRLSSSGPTEGEAAR